jgi:flagellar biogenesis protein FliO
MQAENRQSWKASVLLAVMAVSLSARLQAADPESSATVHLADSVWRDQSDSAGWKNQPQSPRAAGSDQNRVAAKSVATDISPALPAEASRSSAKATIDGTVGIEAESEELQSVLRRIAVATGGLGLAAVIGLWFFRSWLTHRRTATKPVQSLEVLDSLRIGPRCGLYLVQADRHRVLVGIDQGRTMQMLTLPSSFADTLQEAGATGDAEPDEQMSSQKPAASEPAPIRQMRRFWQSGVA